jgi:hypothetical protein
MDLPPPVRLAQELAPTLRGLDWVVEVRCSGAWALPTRLAIWTCDHGAHFFRKCIGSFLKLGETSSPPTLPIGRAYFARFAPKGLSAWTSSRMCGLKRRTESWSGRSNPPI